MNKLINGGLFAAITLIWGSSFILMKEGLVELSPYQVAALRILSAGIVLLPIAIKQIARFPKSTIGLIVLSGTLGNFIPAFLFCVAETRIDSSLTGILNALTPLFVVAIGILFFKQPFQLQKIIGVVIGFLGLCILFTSKDGFKVDENMAYGIFVVMATILYGVNPNLIRTYLKEVGVLNLAAIAFGILAIPSAYILYTTGYFHAMTTANAGFIRASFATVILGVFGTAVAQILFLTLLKRTNPIYSALPTYFMPFVAILWGVWYGETIKIQHLLCLGIILLGVYVTNKKWGHPKTPPQ